MENNKIHYLSSISSMISGYIEEKRAVGYKYDKAALISKQLDNLLIRQGFNGEVLTKDIVLIWTEKRKGESDSTRNARISLIKGLALYMTRLGHRSYIYPEKAVPIDRHKYTPYIFSEEELAKFFDAVDSLPSTSASPYRHLILPLLFRILYGCGLRVSEASNLKITDVNLKDGILFIRHAKLGKERIVPMASSLVERCKKYAELVLKNNLDNPFYFPSPFGDSYDGKTIYSFFRKLLWRAGISHGGRGHGPRVHDFRHSHSIHCLKKWVINGNDLTTLLPYLSAYLGHADLRGTEYYLKLTADLYPTILAKVETCYSNLIPGRSI